MTPIEERVELRHYYIHRVPELGTRGYINIRADNPLELSVSDRDTADGAWQTSFTMAEVYELEREYNESYSSMLEEVEVD